MGRLTHHQRYPLIDRKGHLLCCITNLEHQLTLNVLLNLLGTNTGAIIRFIQHQQHLLASVLQQVGNLKEELDIPDAVHLQGHQRHDPGGHIEHSQGAILKRSGRINHNIVKLLAQCLKDGTQVIGAHQFTTLGIWWGEQHLYL